MARKIAGVVLAGGRSSRMGKDKSSLVYKGKTLLEHMMALLQQTGVDDVYVSGNFDGYSCIADSTPDQGPAHAMYDVLKYLAPYNYDGVLFVPVDMPLLNVEILEMLINKTESRYFAELFLPTFIMDACLEKPEKSIQDFLKSIESHSLSLPMSYKNSMKNVNTIEQWNEVRGA